MIDMIRVGQTRNLLRASSSLLEIWPRSAHHHPGQRHLSGRTNRPDKSPHSITCLRFRNSLQMRAASTREGSAPVAFLSPSVRFCDSNKNGPASVSRPSSRRRKGIMASLRPVSSPQPFRPLRYPDHLRACRRRSAPHGGWRLHSTASDRFPRRKRPDPYPALHA